MHSPRICHNVLASKGSTREQSVVEACVHHVRIRVLNFSYNVGQWDSINSMDSQEVVTEGFLPLRPLPHIFELPLVCGR